MSPNGTMAKKPNFLRYTKHTPLASHNAHECISTPISTLQTVLQKAVEIEVDQRSDRVKQIRQCWFHLPCVLTEFWD